MYLLGVDGGSTKIDFALSDLTGNILFEYRLYEPSNLKYVGFKDVIENLKIGFSEIKKAGYDLKNIKGAYFGIAECGAKSGIVGRSKILTFLGEVGFGKFVLADDQYSVFASLAKSKYGVLANAGTGSNINYFSDNGEKTYKSLGHGGRDFGKIILAQVKYGNFDTNSQVYKILHEFLGCSPLDFYDRLSASEFVISKEITQISRVLFNNYKENLELQKELDFLLVTIADRWGSKITSYCWANFGFNIDSEFDLVLAGSMWNWVRIESIAIAEIKKVFKNVNILHNPKSKPVVGCIKLAKELI